jgi:plasmid maintenance system antidote protein VapI
MNEATRNDAVSIARLLNVNKETVWEIIKGMKYSVHSELAMAVHKAFSL